MEAKPAKCDDWINKAIDMSKVKLKNLKPIISKKITDILQIEEFVYSQLDMEQFICPKMMQINMIGFLNGPILKEFIGELWTLLLAAEESSTSITNVSVEPNKDDFRIKGFSHQKSHENNRSRKQDDAESSKREPHFLPSVLSAEQQRPNYLSIKNPTNSCGENPKSNVNEKTYNNTANQSNNPVDTNISSHISSEDIPNSNEHQQSRRSSNDEPKMMTCAVDTFDTIFPYSPQDWHQEANVISQDQCPKTPLREFLAERCVKLDEFLEQWNQPPDKETSKMSKKFIYSDANNVATSIGKQVCTTLSSAKECSTGSKTDSILVQEKKDEVLAKQNHTEHQKSKERSKPNLHCRSRKEGDTGSSGKERKIPFIPFGKLSMPLRPIDMSTIKLDTLRPCIAKKIADILQKEDNRAVEFVFNKLKQERLLCPKKLQINIAGFLSGINGLKFLNDLWPLLLSAQQNDDGIPPELNTTTLLPPAAVEILESKQPNQIKSETKLITISELPSRKRIRSTKSNENKKSKNNSSGKDEQQPAKKKRKMSEKSSSKCSSEKVSSRNSEADSNENKSQPNCSSQLMLHLYLTDDDDN